MKKIIKLITIIFVLLFSINIYAQEVKYNDGSARSDMENYGVHKHWNITEQNKPNVMRTPYVDSSLKIYDYANILSDEEEKELKPLIDKYIEETGMDMVFVSIDMPYYNDHDNEDYAADFYDYNDFGLNDSHYSGVLLLRNAYEQDPYFNVYTFGEGQLYYDYDRCEMMLDHIYPYFKQKEYNEGIKLFIDDFTSYYHLGKALPDYYVDEDGFIHIDKGAFKPAYGVASASGGIITLIVLSIMVKKNKMIKKAQNAADYEDKSKTNFKKKTDLFVSTFTTRHRLSSDSSGGGGGHSSSFGSSGGGHGGGGGRHG